ncbi:sulfite exporter TauE/SafE family protein [Aliidiomarina halalkaliphila]|uniref:Probable membrane transporter protein n=1 Tax=Aliidiomarina halalkaliphila TaxID=2593535 RepID=A0A552X5R1_9GAMM|nr:sulfite exporter TauE/SafE family protein [Aliidiomarina halalkaliphila]TRW50340.1 sulfite exporter TauE/SafE family protein [Aliidiomarina halalkaliphila]
MISLLICVLAGVFAGLLSGMLGIGGGVLIVPLLIYLLPSLGLPASIVVPTAIGTSLATIMVTTLSGARAHAKRGYVEWPWVKLLLPTLLLGGFFGAYLGTRLPAEVLQRIFAVILTLLAVRMIWKHTPHKPKGEPILWLVRVWGSVIGVVSALVGIGGGALVVPLLHFYQVAMRNAVAVAAVTSVVLSAVGTATYMFAAPALEQGRIPGLIGYVYLPAWLAIVATSAIFARVGAAIAHRLPVRYLQRGFAILLISIAVHLFMT